MASKEAAKACTRVVRPVMSTNMAEARVRVKNLYRSFYRHIPYAARYFDIAKNEDDYRKKLRECFLKNCHVTDIRVIDILVIKGYMELKEITNRWQQKSYVLSHWNPSAEPQPVDFVGKFIAGID